MNFQEKDEIAIDFEYYFIGTPEFRMLSLNDDFDAEATYTLKGKLPQQIVIGTKSYISSFLIEDQMVFEAIGKSINGILTGSIISVFIF